MTEARVNITYGGQNADLPQTVDANASTDTIKRFVIEALLSGSVAGLTPVAGEDFSGYTVDPLMPAIEGRNYDLFVFRPKTRFGA